MSRTVHSEVTTNTCVEQGNAEQSDIKHLGTAGWSRTLLRSATHTCVDQVRVEHRSSTILREVQSGIKRYLIRLVKSIVTRIACLEQGMAANMLMN